MLIMESERQTRRTILSWVIIGALGGGIFAALDGAILGAVLGGTGVDEAGPADAALRWAGYFAAAGVLLGGVVAGVARAIAPRLVLRPPGDVETNSSSGPAEKPPPETGA
jgi:hypothetical protein